MRTRISIYLFSLSTVLLFASCGVWGTKENKAVNIVEPKDPQPVSSIQEWNELNNKLQVAWGNSNRRYHKFNVPRDITGDDIQLKGWRNERVNAQLVIWTKDSIENLSINVSDLKSGKNKISSDVINHYFIRNVIADDFGGCGKRTKTQENAHLVADCFEEAHSITMDEKTTRGIWFNIDIPEETHGGIYKSDVTVKSDGKDIKTLSLTVHVMNRILPGPDEWKYHLDLWQNPYAVSRIHNVELWSDHHFEKMKPLYEMLAGVGQKCITTSILHTPWGGQTYDPFGSMIKRTLNTDGTWNFDYSIFDEWVEFMMDLGIKKQINCYSLIPWGNQLWYYDEITRQDTFIVATASSPEFTNYWKPFLIDFSQHLKSKGWYDITTIAMDERPMKDMQKAIKLIAEYSGLKVTSAANYNPGLSGEIYDLSIGSGHILPKKVLEQRKSNRQITTYYVCCVEPYPNNFTFSPPSEGVWQGWFTYAKNLDGFLRWAYNSWVEDPMQDTRFRQWSSGDTFFVYPGAKSSIRFEKLREGIQDYEKLAIVVEELRKLNTPEASKKLVQINSLLTEFEIESIRNKGTEPLILRAKNLLNSL